MLFALATTASNQRNSVVNVLLTASIYTVNRTIRTIWHLIPNASTEASPNPRESNRV